MPWLVINPKFVGFHHICTKKIIILFPPTPLYLFNAAPKIQLLTNKLKLKPKRKTRRLHPGRFALSGKGLSRFACHRDVESRENSRIDRWLRYYSKRRTRRRAAGADGERWLKSRTGRRTPTLSYRMRQIATRRRRNEFSGCEGEYECLHTRRAKKGNATTRTESETTENCKSTRTQACAQREWLQED